MGPDRCRDLPDRRRRHHVRPPRRLTYRPSMLLPLRRRGNSLRLPCSSSAVRRRALSTASRWICAVASRSWALNCWLAPRVAGGQLRCSSCGRFVRWRLTAGLADEGDEGDEIGVLATEGRVKPGATACPPKLIANAPSTAPLTSKLKPLLPVSGVLRSAHTRSWSRVGQRHIRPKFLQYYRDPRGDDRTRRRRAP